MTEENISELDIPFTGENNPFTRENENSTNMSKNPRKLAKQLRNDPKMLNFINDYKNEVAQINPKVKKYQNTVNTIDTDIQNNLKSLSLSFETKLKDELTFYKNNNLNIVNLNFKNIMNIILTYYFI